MNTHVDELVMQPTRHFDNPGEVLTYPGLKHKDRLRILESWKLDAQRLAESTAENMSGGEKTNLRDVSRALMHLKSMEHLPGFTRSRTRPIFGFVLVHGPHLPLDCRGGSGFRTRSIPGNLCCHGVFQPALPTTRYPLSGQQRRPEMKVPRFFGNSGTETGEPRILASTYLFWMACERIHESGSATRTSSTLSSPLCPRPHRNAEKR